MHHIQISEALKTLKKVHKNHAHNQKHFHTRLVRIASLFFPLPVWTMETWIPKLGLESTSMKKKYLLSSFGMVTGPRKICQQSGTTSAFQ